MKTLVSKNATPFLTEGGKATAKGRELIKGLINKDFGIFNGEDTKVTLADKVDSGKRIVAITNANGETLYAKVEITVSEKPFSEPKPKAPKVEKADTNEESEIVFE